MFPETKPFLNGTLHYIVKGTFMCMPERKMKIDKTLAVRPSKENPEGKSCGSEKDQCTLGLQE